MSVIPEDNEAMAPILEAARGTPSPSLLRGWAISRVVDPKDPMLDVARRTGLLPGEVPHGGRRVLRETVVDRAHVDDRDAEVDRRAPHPQVQDRQLLLEVRGEQHDRGRAVEVGDGRAGQPEHELRREAVAELGVDVVGADDALGEPRPRVGVLVGASRSADHGDARGSAGRDCRLDERCGTIECLDHRTGVWERIGTTEIVFSHIDQNRGGLAFPEENFVFGENFRTLLRGAGLDRAMAEAKG